MTASGRNAAGDRQQSTGRSRVRAVLGALALLGGLATGAAATECVRVVGTNRVTGLANFVGVTDGEPTDAATFLDLYAYTFGVSNPTEQLRLIRVDTDFTGAKHSRYQEVYFGVPVFGAGLIVHQRETGEITDANGDFFPIPPALDPVPTLDRDTAAQIALDAFGHDGNPTVSSEDLTIVNPRWYGGTDRGIHLVYYIQLDRVFPFDEEGFFIDAHVGVIIDRFNMLLSLQPLAAPPAAAADATPTPAADCVPPHGADPATPTPSLTPSATVTASPTATPLPPSVTPTASATHTATGADAADDGDGGCSITPSPRRTLLLPLVAPLVLAHRARRRRTRHSQR